jgi:hypothetical protein
VKSTHRGLAKPDDPVYQQGWTSYIGPLQRTPIEKPTNSTPPKNPESTKSSEAAEKQVAEPEKPEE